MSAAVQPAQCFGKTPRHGDFVRHRVGDALRAFDEWVGRAVFEGRRRPGFDPAYDAGAMVRFVYAPPRAAVPLVGALCPSRDRSGRRYPFIVAAEAPGLTAASDVPARLAPFLDAAAAVASDAAAGRLDHYALVERLVEVDAAPALPAGQGLARRLGAFGGDLWGDFDDARKYVLFRNLHDVMRGDEDGLRFPLGTAPAADAHVWLAVVERLAEVSPSVFAVYEGGPAVGSPNLLAYTGPPHANALLHLFVPGSDADGVVELEGRGAEDGARAALALPATLGTLIEDGSLPLRDFLARL
ncbi:type VI secretion system-associated protein TagF [Rubrivirga sp.]|uniref:type VI secretion system-associated protein TagF n=1 Tax=Rubrivirga sp. TaxID=1885344 RepID=UPI003B51BC0E